MKKRDRHSEPFTRMVVLGESTVAGACASAEERRWVNIVARLIGLCQGKPVELHNKGLSASVISPRSPGYAASAKPSALERYREDVIALKPDLFILSYGLNDMRAGMPVEDFRQDMREIIINVKEACNPVTVLTTVYYMSAYDLYPPFNVGSIQASEVYNLVIRQLAEENDCILADIWAAENQADWVVHPDTVHANDLGHLLIAHRVFEAIATNCSGTAAAITESLQDAKAEVARTMAQRRMPQQYDTPAS
jgi:lysophospholipase L1-like esterase